MFDKDLKGGHVLPDPNTPEGREARRVLLQRSQAEEAKHGHGAKRKEAGKKNAEKDKLERQKLREEEQNNPDILNERMQRALEIGKGKWKQRRIKQ